MGLSEMEKERYSRQIILKEIGEEGQARLLKSSVAIVGCGALGGTVAGTLARAGIGRILIIDRDIVELNNLQRQTIFDEHDIGRSKSMACAEKLRHINSEIVINQLAEDLNPSNAETILQDNDVVVDATDNMETRFLINDVCVKQNIPWVYGGAIEVSGMSMNIVPGRTPCLRCINPQLPQPGLMPTCDTVGVLNTIPAIVASIQCTEVIKILLGHKPNDTLLMFNVWKHEYKSIAIEKNEKCECCVKHNYEYLNTKNRDIFSKLCGANAIQIIPAENISISFEGLAEKLRKAGDVEFDETMMKFRVGEFIINIFKNGRVVIQGTEDEKIARSLYARYLGV